MAELHAPDPSLLQVLGRAKVVCSTLTGALAYDLRDLTFDVVVVDEAAQVWSVTLKECR